ncbi:hypothetical protein F9K33_02525 [bacterium]|nr:MAG: hypothetical protein F9K33_02525 [bacterium]
MANLQKFSLSCLILFLIGAVNTAPLSAQIGNGLGTGKFGTFNTYSAFAMEPGFLTMSNQGRIFASTGQSGNFATTVKNVNLYHASNNFTFVYGFMDHFDALVSIATYQDLNIRRLGSKQATTPGDLYVTVRGGSFEVMDGKIGLGAAISSRIPTGGQNNVPFEVYKSRNAEFGLLTMASLYGNPYYKDQAYLINFNLGFWYYNDNGTVVSPIKNATTSSLTESNVNSTSLQYGFGVLFPLNKVQLMLDAYGISYLTKPVKHAYSRESFTYVTPGLKYNLRSWVNFGVYVDILMTGKTDKTYYPLDQSTGVTKPGEIRDRNTGAIITKGAPNYNSWRLGFNLGFNILPVGFSSAPTEQRRKRLLDRLVEEERGAQKAANQLDKLKSVRLNAEKELEKIKLELEGGQ